MSYLKHFFRRHYCDMMNSNVVLLGCSAVLSILALFLSVCKAFDLNHYYNSNYTAAEAETDYNNYYGNYEIPFSQQTNQIRKSKLFPLFTIIRFTNEPCRTGSEELGVCYTRSQCLKYGGTVSGSCAQNLGVCCQFTSTCGATILQNGTLFRNPDYPTKYRPTGSDFCQVRIRKQYNICQLRLNFIQLDLDGPSTGVSGTAGTSVASGMCNTDAFTISSTGAAIPTVCGQLQGQHMYVTFGSSDTVTLSVMLSGNSQRDREWNIQILMYSCKSTDLLAPPGCLQYFQGVSGEVRSFNYMGGTHLVNQDYTACVRLQDGMRSIEWSPCETGSVRISGAAVAATGGAAAPTLHNGCGNPFDYLIIPGGVPYPLSTGTTIANPSTTQACLLYNPGGFSCVDRFCDYNFQVTGQYIRSTFQPFTLHFRTDATEVVQQANAGGTATATTDANLGFCLRYQQSPQG